MHDAHQVAQDQLEGLPPPVRRYLRYTGVVGTPWIHDAVLTQTGRFRQGPNRAWMPMTAEQIYTTGPPSFVWDARFKVAGLPLLRARDEYRSGHGHMRGKLAGLFTIFDVRGEKLDQGAMLRYLSEMIWFPTAFLGDNVTWQARDEHSAEVTLEDGGRSVSACMTIDPEGRPVELTAMRYREVDGDFSLDPWSTPITGYGVRSGLNLPTRASAVWKLPSGDLPYIDLEIGEVKYNSLPASG